MNYTKKIKGWKFVVYSYNNDSVSILPYLSIGRYKYQGETSIGCLKWNITFGWIVIGFSITNTHQLPKIKPLVKPKGKPFNIFDGIKIR